MYCGKCGKENKEEAMFCFNCGAPLGKVPVPPTPVKEDELSETGKHINKESVGEKASTDNNSGNVNNITISMGESKHSHSSAGNGEGMAIASMILGIVALVVSCCFYYVSLPCAIISVVLAAVTLKGNRGGRGMAIAGLVCSVISLIPAAIMISTGAAIVSIFN